MDIIIPTLGRHNRQTTFDALPMKWQDKTLLAVQAHESHLYDRYPHLVLPENIKDIASTRHYLVHECEQLRSDNICMIDDDLVFSARRTDEPTKFRTMFHEDYDEMFGEVIYQLRHYAHVGISHREGANRNTERFADVTRQMRVLAFQKKVLAKHALGYGRVPVMEDFDMTLRLLKLGLPNRLCNMWVHNQGGSNTSGGCSTFRTLEMQNAAAHKLAALHPGYVKTVRKQTKDSWGGQERTDVTVYWKRAYNDHVK